MERVKIDSKYVAVIEDKDGRKQEIFCVNPDISRVMNHERNGVVLGCIVYPLLSGQTKCVLYYNDGNYPEEELRAAGYDIVTELKRVDVYEETESVFNAQK